MKKLLVFLALSLASLAVQANSLHYLEERTAYCYSSDSLAKYLHMAQARNIDGLNALVLKGECDFVPDGQVYSLTDFQKDAIGTMPVIAFERDDQTLWTFKAFMTTSEFNSL
jgi:hypothetical protein